jgi:hypothetical protein
MSQATFSPSDPWMAQQGFHQGPVHTDQYSIGVGQPTASQDHAFAYADQLVRFMHQQTSMPSDPCAPAQASNLQANQAASYHASAMQTNSVGPAMQVNRAVGPQDPSFWDTGIVRPEQTAAGLLTDPRFGNASGQFVGIYQVPRFSHGWLPSFTSSQQLSVSTCVPRDPSFVGEVACHHPGQSSVTHTSTHSVPSRSCEKESTSSSLVGSFSSIREASTVSSHDGQEADERCVTDSPHSNTRSKQWSKPDRTKHSDACKSKDRLTLKQKLEVIYLHTRAPSNQRKNQSELARIFGKARTTISRLLRPENISKTKELAASGVRMEARRCKRPQYPELERRLFELLGSGSRIVTKAEIVFKAEQLAVQMNISDMVADYNWCMRFIKQHDLVIHKQNVENGQDSGQTGPRTGIAF